MQNDYVLFGIQGSGKGTQGKKLVEKLMEKVVDKDCFPLYFETGEQLRRKSQETSELGKKIKSIIDAGHLVPNEVVTSLVENVFGAPKIALTSIVFDGIPRNQEQNTTFENLLKKHSRQYTGIYFELSREEAENRLLKRRMCSACKTVYPAAYTSDRCATCEGKLVMRADDNAESIRTRIDIFYKETMPVIEDWKKRGKIVSVNAAGTMEEVNRELVAKLSL